jgi:hypothetical protein
MRFLKCRTIFYLGCALILAMAIYASANAAFASSGTGATVTVKSGGLSLSGPANVTAPPVVLGSKNMTSAYNLPLTLKDARGTGAGWNLTITSTPFTSGSHTLANSSSSIGMVVETCNPHSTCTPPINSVKYPVAVPAGTPPPAAVTFFNAAAHSGLGSFTITPTVTISAAGMPGTYTGNVYVAIGSMQPITIKVTLTVQQKGGPADPPPITTAKYTLVYGFNNPGNDWHLSITSTQLAGGGTLPTTASSIMGTAVCQVEQNCFNNMVTYPIVLPAGNPAPTPVMFYDPTATAGIGNFGVTTTINVALPANAYPGTYTSTLTIAFQSGP